MKMILTLTSAWTSLAVTLILLAAMFILDWKYQKECKRSDALNTLNHKNEIKYAHNLQSKNKEVIELLKIQIDLSTKLDAANDKINYYYHELAEKDMLLWKLRDQIKDSSGITGNCKYCGKHLNNNNKFFCSHNCQNSYQSDKSTKK